MIDRKRRTVLKATVAGGVLAGIAGAGLSMPGRLLAAWSEDAFLATTWDKALAALFPGAEDIGIGPDNAQNEAISFEGTKEAPANARSVPVSVTSTVPNTKSITILIEKNPRPLAAHFEFEPGAVPAVHVRVKMKETSRIIALVKDSAGKFHSRAMKITVKESGCAA